MNLIGRMAGNGNGTSFHAVTILSMTSASSIQCPAILFDQLDQVSELHYEIPIRR